VEYAPAAQARHLRLLLDALGHERVVVAGHDLGVAIAVELAAAAPDRVSALVLCSGVVHAQAWPPRHVAPLLVPGFGQAYLTALRHTPGAVRTTTARALGLDANTPLPDRELEAYLRPLARTGAERALRSVARAADFGSVQRAWERVRSAPPPTLLLWGEHDRVHRLDYGRRLASELPSAVWAPVSDVGHLLPQERPERFAEELTGFLSEQAGLAGRG
jgi:pimeloyl-ACP methyl ester carboxylesterase